MLLVFNVFRSFVAIGILTLPYGVKLVGPTLAFIELLLVATFVSIPTMLLLEVADKSKFKGANFEILGKLLWGKFGHILIIFCLSLASMSAFMGGILFSVDFLSFAFCEHKIDSVCESKKMLLFFSMIVSFAISIIESLKPFGYVSISSTIIIIIAFISITIYNLYYILYTEDNIAEKLTKFDLSNFFSFFGLAFYTSEGIGLVTPLRATFKDNIGFSKIFFGTFSLIVWVYVILSVLSFVVR